MKLTLLSFLVLWYRWRSKASHTKQMSAKAHSTLCGPTTLSNLKLTMKPYKMRLLLLRWRVTPRPLKFSYRYDTVNFSHLLNRYMPPDAIGLGPRCYSWWRHWACYAWLAHLSQVRSCSENPGLVPTVWHALWHPRLHLSLGTNVCFHSLPAHFFQVLHTNPILCIVSSILHPLGTPSSSILSIPC